MSVGFCALVHYGGQRYNVRLICDTECMKKGITFIILGSTVILLAGVAVHMAALAAIDRLVQHFPSVNDVILAHLPRYNLFAVGEAAFAVFCVLFGIAYCSRQWRTLPQLLIMVGVMYAIRAVFLFTLPIGSPPDALLLSERYTLYPYANHAYFFGGHAALLYLFSFSLTDRCMKTLFLLGATLFVIGSLITRAHYTADVIAGFLIGVGISSWGGRHLSSWTIKTQ